MFILIPICGAGLERFVTAILPYSILINAADQADVLVTIRPRLITVATRFSPMR
jgi:hypothetical protein